MIQNTIDVTESRQDKNRDSERTTVITADLKKGSEAPRARDDISAALVYWSFADSEISHERTRLISEQEIYDNQGGFTQRAQVFVSYDPTEEISEDRIKLLARKYASNFISNEDNARLSILTERFNKMMPSITEKDLEVMEDFRVKLESAIKLNERLENEYED